MTGAIDYDDDGEEEGDVTADAAENNEPLIKFGEESEMMPLGGGGRGGDCRCHARPI